MSLRGLPFTESASMAQTALLNKEASSFAPFASVCSSMDSVFGNMGERNKCPSTSNPPLSLMASLLLSDSNIKNG
jgi:hypothetical protein